MRKTDWTRLLAMALVLPLAGACAEGGEDEFEETETLETTTTTEMSRVELETFGTADLEGWVTARTEGQELILTLNLDEGWTGMRETPEAGTEGELGTEREAGAARAQAEEMRHSARLVEGMCSDVRPGAGRTASGQTPSEETGQPEPEAGQGQQPVRTVAQFRTPDEWGTTGTGEARPGAERSGEPGATARTTTMGGETLEAHVQLSEITGRNYAVVVEDGEAEGMTGHEPTPGGEENIVACADVTELVRNTRTGRTGQPTDAGSEESGSSY